MKSPDNLLQPPPGRFLISRPWTFWGGVLAITVGVLLHIPDWWSTVSPGPGTGMEDEMPVGYMAGMEMSAGMTIGMLLVLAGVIASGYGLLPPRSARFRGRVEYAQLRTMDDAPLRPAHRALAVAVGVAIIIDTMKPATLGFVLPGMAAEYGISTQQVAWFPFMALTGTTVGSVAWGLLADRLGRSASILLSGLLFMATSVCAFMPEFHWNLVMCFLMGASAGGMLPIAYALMAESLPANQRGWYIVLQTGLGSVGGYLVAAAAASVLEPVLGWRVLWMLNLPTALLLIILNRWIPESPRFLLATGREDEARQVMARYGVILETSAAPAPDTTPEAEPTRAGGMGRLFASPYGRHTAVVVCYALAWGLVNWGFITFLPTFLGGTGNNLLMIAALLAIPNTFLAARLYSAWSSKRSMVLYGVLTVASLAGFALVPRSTSTGMVVLVAVLLAGTGGMIAMIAPYTTELYPTELRASGSGLSAAASKVGGMVGPGLVAAIATASSLRLVAVLMALPVVATTFALGLNGRETSGKPLPEHDDALV